MRKEAYAGFEAGIRQFTKDARFALHYALALLKEGETGDLKAELRGEELLRSAVKLDPSSAEGHYQLGQLAFNDGHFADALEDYQTAAKLDPKNPKVHFGLSKAYRRLGRKEEASRETELFQELQTEKPGASPPTRGER
jgi:tetratricopeptide (TPR) repeat protein